jgi:hypothetical protein
MTANIDLLEALSSVSDQGIEQNKHPYERASEDDRRDYDRDIEQLAKRREARERAAASLPD